MPKAQGKAPRRTHQWDMKIVEELGRIISLTARNANVIIIQKLPPKSDPALQATTCAYVLCPRIRCGIKPDSYRVSIEPRDNLNLAAPPLEPIRMLAYVDRKIPIRGQPTEAKVAKRNMNHRGYAKGQKALWYCLDCLEKILAGSDKTQPRRLDGALDFQALGELALHIYPEQRVSTPNHALSEWQALAVMKWRATIFSRMVEAAIAYEFDEDAIKKRYWLGEVEETDFVKDGLLSSKEACEGPEIHDREKHQKTVAANQEGDHELFLDSETIRSQPLSRLLPFVEQLEVRDASSCKLTEEEEEVITELRSRVDDVSDQLAEYSTTTTQLSENEQTRLEQTKEALRHLQAELRKLEKRQRRAIAAAIDSEGE